MAKKRILLMPSERKILATVGEQIRLARLRRDLPMSLVAERARVSPGTVAAVEAGSPATSIGAYTAVLHALGGMDKDLLKIAADDVTGRTFQDLHLPTRARASKRTRG